MHQADSSVPYHDRAVEELPRSLEKSARLGAGESGSPTHLPHSLPLWNPPATTRQHSHLLGSSLHRAKVDLNGIGDVFCSRRRLATLLKPPEEAVELTILRAEEALDGGVASFDGVDVERGAEEPLAHEDSTEGRAGDVEDACAVLEGSVRYFVC